MSAPPRRALQRFHVAVKALLVHEGRLLFVRESTREGWWELPGGRIDVGEEGLAQSDVLRRELAEELGPEFQCEIGEPYLTWIRPVKPELGEYTFVVAHLCDEPRGAIRLSHEHVDHVWADEDAARALALAPGYARPMAQFWRRWSGGGRT